MNTIVGAFTENVGKIDLFLKQANQLSADLVLFPELTMSSYPPLDLLDRPAFLAENLNALHSLEKLFSSYSRIPKYVVIGSILPNPMTQGRALLNAALVYENGKKVYVQPKRLLPTYDVFDEARYFEPGTAATLVDTAFGKMGVSVCEDAWFDDTHMNRKVYREDPAVALKGCDFAINISASPFEMNKRLRRKEQVSSFASRIGAPLFYVNQVGSNDEILFDGGSLSFSKSGDVLAEMPHFKEGIGIVEVDAKFQVMASSFHELSLRSAQKSSSNDWKETSVGRDYQPESLELLHQGLVTGVRDYFAKTGFKKAVLGLSGGIDSAVVACLAVEALGRENVIGFSLPSQYSSSHSLSDAEALARNLGIEYRVHSLKFIFSSLQMELKPSFHGAPPDVTEENIQARLRGLMLMALANKRGALLLTTGNKSELAVGYCTTYGDMAGALGPLGDVYKTRVYELAKFINKKTKWIPESSITKPPSAELRPNQTDQDSLPPYDVLDRLLEAHFEGSADADELLQAGFDEGLVSKILHLIRISEFKRRQAAPVLKVTSKAFGLGRRIPIAKAF